MMDSTSGPVSSSARTEAPAVSAGSAAPFLVGSVASPTGTTAPPNRPRPHRSRRGFAAGKSRLSLRIDADCAETSSVTAQSTPASTSSSCSSSDVVPWWEVEYQCPPPGHLGAHVVPVSGDEQAEQRSSITTAISCNNTTQSADNSELSTPTEAHPTSSSSSCSQQIRPGLVVYETPERARRGPRSKLSAIRASVPCLLVDSSPSQKRKMRSQDPTDAEADLFPTHVTKELKRFHESSCSSSLKKSSLPSRVVTPSTLVQPLTQIGISQTLRLKPRTLTPPQATEKPRTAQEQEP